MKKKLTILAATALFSMGLAFYANNLKSVDILLENNVEALSEDSGDPSGMPPYMEFGSSPNRVIADMQTHVLVIENMRQEYDSKGRPLNGCISDPGSACVINTTTSVYNFGQVVSFLDDFFKALQALGPIISFIMSLIH